MAMKYDDTLYFSLSYNLAVSHFYVIFDTLYVDIWHDRNHDLTTGKLHYLSLLKENTL
jgi:hypothetical protein